MVLKRERALAALGFFALSACTSPRTRGPVADVSVTVLGDYLAAGSGASDPRDAAAFVAVMKGVGGRLRTLDSFAMPYGSMRDVGDLQAPRLLPGEQIVIVMAGSSDLVIGTPAVVFADDYENALRRINRRVREKILLCVGLPDAELLESRLTDRYDDAAVVRVQFNDVIRAACSRNGGGFVALDGLASRAADGPYISSDRFHPNSRGYGLLVPPLTRAVRDAVLLLDGRRRNKSQRRGR